MNVLEEVYLQCPYCAEQISVLVDCSIPQQQYVEDCAVCCQPIVLDVCVNECNNVSLVARRENE